MARPESVSLEFRLYPDSFHTYCNDFVADLPGLIITQFLVNQRHIDKYSPDTTALRFDFVDDWYSVLAFLDHANQPTGHYIIYAQTPLMQSNGIWKGDNLLLKLVVKKGWNYSIEGEERFLSAVDDGWMRIDSALNARESIRKICTMLDDRSLPLEVMDAVNSW
ncbi:MAG: hypothetical protein ACYC27_18110 [Armatimonadota bacterium]